MEDFSSVCQNCGSDLFYNPQNSCLTCKYCGSNFFLPTSKKNSVIVRQYSVGFHPSMLNKNLNSYKCKTCGRGYFMTTEGSSSRCPNCGGGECELAGEPGFCADGVIPFKITKEQASKYMKEYLKRDQKIPKELKEMAENQKLMSVLIPVWNFSFNLYATYSAIENISKKDIYGNYYSVPNAISGEKNKRVKSLDECATDGEDDLILSLFDEKDYEKIVPYSPEYAFGARVDEITKDIHKFYAKIVEKAEADYTAEIRRELLNRKNETTNIDVYCKADDVFFNFTYVPVYINICKYRERTYKLYISGVNGKIVGKTPTSVIYRIRKALRIVGIGALLAIIIRLFKK